MSEEIEYEPVALSYHETHMWAMQLHVILMAGVPLHAGLELLAMSDMPRVSPTSALLAETIGQGRRLSEAMSMLAPSFSPFVVNLVAVGEKSGRIAHVFERISARSYRRDKTQRSIQSALAYPVFLGVICLGMAFFMAFYMFPKLLPFLTGLGVALPWPTRLLLFGTRHMVTVLLVSIVVVVWLGHLVASKERLRDWVLYKLPVFGKVNSERVYADCLNDLYLMLEAQCDLLGSLRSLNPPWRELQDKISDCVRDLRAGASLTDAVDKSGFLPRRFLAPVSSAEETGRLPATFRLLSEQLEESVTLEIERLVQFVEPVIMGGMGLVTGFVVIATFLPLYGMISTGL